MIVLEKFWLEHWTWCNALIIFFSLYYSFKKISTIVIPPALPVAFTMGTAFALSRLKKVSVYCIEPKRFLFLLNYQLYFLIDLYSIFKK